ncbi:MAG: ABC transporter permease [Actinobacteria bacterium]|nr:MAG: ABC transporter permease [Actinomycetota bacterium]
MTTLLDSPSLAKASESGPNLFRLMRAEVAKIRTTKTWWLLAIGIVAFTALAFTSNAFGHHFELQPPAGAQPGPEEQAQIAQAHTAAGLARIAADMLTSGQFFGLLLALIMGILVVTNEFFHQTATTTFMTSPHRTTVVLAKAAAAILFAVLFWAVSTVLDIVATPIYLHSQHVTVSLTQWTVVQSVLLNLLAFAIWAIFGMGLGTLIRSQIGSVITGMALYLIGTAAVAIIGAILYNVFHQVWIRTAQVIAPAVASMIMITPGEAYPHAAPQWVGGAVLIGYAIVTGFVGILIMRRRDIS